MISNVFFNPSDKTLEWIVEYAKDRFIVDVGAGSGHLAWRLNEKGAKIMCIEPLFEPFKSTSEFIRKGIQWFPHTVEDSENLIKGISDSGKAIFMFARPCHSDFVENCLDMLKEGTESLYITRRENLELYNDVGRYMYTIIKELENESDDEVICSIIK
jgi:hypothetical protein